MPRKSNRLRLAAMMVMMVCSGLALAQKNEVFFTGPSNTIQRADFATSTATPVYRRERLELQGPGCPRGWADSGRERDQAQHGHGLSPRRARTSSLSIRWQRLRCRIGAISSRSTPRPAAITSSWPSSAASVVCSTCLPVRLRSSRIPLKQITTAGGLAIQQLVDVDVGSVLERIFSRTAGFWCCRSGRQ